MNKKTPPYLFAFIVFVCFVLVGSVPAFAKVFSARNFTTQEKEYATPLHHLTAGVLWLPRQSVNAVLFGAEKTAVYLSDPDFVRTVKDILYIKEPELLWYPRVDYHSGFRPSYGAGLRYLKGGVLSRTSFDMGDSELWAFKTEATYTKYFTNAELVFEAGLSLEERDDLKFAGFGAKPERDSRNTFLSDTDDGVFSQDARRFRWQAGYKKWHGWDFIYNGFLSRKAFKDHGSGKNDLRDVFRTAEIPGFTIDAPVWQNYHELAVGFDNRRNRQMMSPGLRAEVYNGISTGLKNNKTNTYRLGGDLQGFFSLGHEDRLMVPRVVLDWVKDINGREVPLSELSKHPTFRGVSSREWVASDRASSVLSLEYQWRISHILGGHIFTDYVSVGKDWASLKWKHGLWAIGGGLDLRWRVRELGRIEFAGGSEGFQFKFSVGKPVRSNQRYEN